MFPFKNSGNLSFQNPNYVEEEEENMVENQINWADIGSEGLESMNTSLNNREISRRGRGRGRGQGRGRRQNSSFDPNNESGPSNYCDDEEQKRKHREVERQRRQEMSDLYSALRSQIPDQYIQGKRSTSDHVAEAANYIKDLEKNIKELSIRRDELKATPEWRNPTYEVGGSSSNPNARPGSVVINPCLGGIAINIDVGYEDQTFSLSSALQVLFEEGLSVSSCTSTKINDRIVHDIICEVK
ncbi:unnamed protein product [Amaranthus hypochondriacus]